jgi:hypothetical protein
MARGTKAERRKDRRTTDKEGRTRTEEQGGGNRTD